MSLAKFALETKKKRKKCALNRMKKGSTEKNKRNIQDKK